jgi:hypothetical protein
MGYMTEECIKENQTNLQFYHPECSVVTEHSINQSHQDPVREHHHSFLPYVQNPFNCVSRILAW